MNTATIVQKLWNFCNVLRDDGMSYGDYVEQLTFTKSQNKFQDPAKLRRLIVDLIENGVSVQANVSNANVKAHSVGRSYKETWVSMSADVKGDAYEGLLEKNAGHQVRRGPVLHAAPADPGDCRRHGAHTQGNPSDTTLR